MTVDAVVGWRLDLFTLADGVAPSESGTVSTTTFCDRLAALFKQHQGAWIDGRELATVAGAYAWRSRVSDLRRAPYCLNIVNRQRRVGRAVVSEYRLAQSDDIGTAA